MSAVCYRGFPDGKEQILRQYKVGRPIQWGAFTSTTTSLDAARAFASAAEGVIFRIRVLSGKDIGTVSFYPTENEVLLGPSHKFLVTSETGGYQEGGYTMVELMQQSGEWFVS